MQNSHEIVVVGGGLVGGSVACALAMAGRDVALIEATSPQGAPPPSFDERNLALAAASLNALEALGVLSHLTTPPSPIRHIHISRAGDFGSVQLDAREQGCEAFGGVVIARELGAALEARIAALPAIRRYRPLSFQSLQQADEAITLHTHSDVAGLPSTLQAHLLLACDGTDSAVRAALGIEVERHDYRQTLIVHAMRSDRPHQGQAWERFTDTGPLALLPRADGSHGVVCGVASDAAEAMMALSDAEWLTWLQARFGYRAGRFLRCGKRQAYPLVRVLSNALTAPRCAILGNAAQTIHPVGAQGFNLGLRDALSLVDALDGCDDPGSAELLADYAARRVEDRAQTLAFSDGLARLTAGDGFAHHVLRSAGMSLMGALPGAQASLVAGAMGFRGQVPRLSRGVA